MKDKKDSRNQKNRKNLKEQKEQKKLYPWYVLAVSDLLLTAVILCTFSYFHHVRMLWGIGVKDEKTEAVYVFTKPPAVTEAPEPPKIGETAEPGSDSITEADGSYEPASEDGYAMPQVTAPENASPLPEQTDQTEQTGQTRQSEPTEQTDKVPETEPVGVDPLYDISGDFGASFPEMFIQDGQKICLEDSGEILKYASENGITLSSDPDGKYIALYRSHDIFLTVQEVNTTVSYAEKDQPINVQYYIYDIYVRNIENLFTSYSNVHRRTVSQLMDSAEQEQGVSVVASVNGDYIANLNHCLLCERNGEVMREVPKRIESDICILYYDGRIETMKPSEYDWSVIEAGSPYQIWNFGPGLINPDGSAMTAFDSNAYDSNIKDSHHPRTSLGYYEPGHYNFVVVDGRSDDSRGMKMVQLAKLQESLGCTAAYNMDGGDSSQAYFEDRVIRESESRDGGQRRLSDIICIGEVSQ